MELIAPPPTPVEPANHSGRRLLAAAAAIALLVGAGSGAAVWGLLNAVHPGASPARPLHAVSQTAPSTQSQLPIAQTGTGLNLAAITSRVAPSVVDINTVFVTAGSSGKAAGTGIILSSDGEILTNHHVVEGATRIEVAIAGRAGTHTAEVLGVDPSADVALIKVQGVSGLPVATLADTSTLRIGQPVAALGNALGLGGAPSVTEGTITALDQSLTAGGSGTPEQLSGMIESDAPIQPGDSGGPLVNAAGQVIGMTTAGQNTGRRSTASALGYAVPTNKLLPIVNQIRAGKPSAEVIIGATGYIGVSVRDLTPALAARYGVSAATGALVVGVNPGGPAEAAGLGQGAVITEVAGSAITSTRSLGTVLHTHAPGDRIRIGWVDQTGTHSATVTLTTGPAV